ncbi:hypothetical protein RHD99_05455 [Buttiauxella selenatireducens]|uniref:Uncharacterized protein n=1 Tax=Buttiauxella selenatireducens TaxID=3073902 RepID=A0ABY9SD40_9ENTR|nr:hypothetical protein [Buttiauxella sp. R73]WMY75407.1 hypothetical protein RHD99_05455 [Buttiauxella sp. R73]
MAFRSYESAQENFEYALSRLLPKEGTKEVREKAKNVLMDICEKYGPVIDSYPSWHPLVTTSNKQGWPLTRPCPENGYKGLDHTVLFANAFITCPYDGGKEVIASVSNRPEHHAASITAAEIDAVLYHPLATPILVTCDWGRPLNLDKTIPKSLAVALMLEEEIPQWRDAQLAETWETMRPYFLGRPHGARSSLSVDQDTGQAMKTVWNAIINTGMYGPIKV